MVDNLVTPSDLLALPENNVFNVLATNVCLKPIIHRFIQTTWKGKVQNMDILKIGIKDRTSLTVEQSDFLADFWHI